MSVKKRGLGRGLDALLGTGKSLHSAGTDAPDATRTTSSGADEAPLRELPVELIQRGKYQPRRDMEPESLRELADSILAQGVMQPIVVRPISGQKYEIIAGERRWRATQLAGLDVIPAIIRNVSDQAAIAMAFFSFGAASVMLALAYGAREVLAKRKAALMAFSTSGRGKLIFALIFLAMGGMILSGFDKTLEAALVRAMPDWLVDFTTRI